MEPKYNILVRLRKADDGSLDINGSKSFWINKAVLTETDQAFVFEFLASDGSEFLSFFPPDSGFMALVQIPKTDVLGILYRDTPLEEPYWQQLLSLLDRPVEVTA